MTTQELFSKTDWVLLRQQKETLVKLQMSMKEEGEYCDSEMIEGLLSFIDHIQDHAVDTLGIPESVVFNNDTKPFVTYWVIFFDHGEPTRIDKDGVPVLYNSEEEAKAFMLADFYDTLGIELQEYREGNRQIGFVHCELEEYVAPVQWDGEYITWDKEKIRYSGEKK